MNDERRWKAALVRRVVLNSFAGGLLTAIVGALCGLGATAMVSWLDNGANAALKMPSDLNLGSIMMSSLIGGYSWIGGLNGALIFIVATVRAKPSQTFAPLQSLIGRVMLGQIVGTIGFCSLFLSVEAARAAIARQSFFPLAMEDMLWLIFGVPILMICGAIAGALSKRGT